MWSSLAAVILHRGSTSLPRWSCSLARPCLAMRAFIAHCGATSLAARPIVCARTMAPLAPSSWAGYSFRPSPHLHYQLVGGDGFASEERPRPGHARSSALAGGGAGLSRGDHLHAGRAGGRPGARLLREPGPYACRAGRHAFWTQADLPVRSTARRACFRSMMGSRLTCALYLDSMPAHAR